MSASDATILEEGVTERLARRLVARVRDQTAPPPARVVSWMDLVELCRELDETVVIDEPASDKMLRLHQTVLALAIPCGAELIEELGVNDGADIAASGHALDALRASVEMLRIFHSSRHSGLPAEAVEAVRQRIFNAST